MKKTLSALRAVYKIACEIFNFWAILSALRAVYKTERFAGSGRLLLSALRAVYKLIGALLFLITQIICSTSSL